MPSCGFRIRPHSRAQQIVIDHLGLIDIFAPTLLNVERELGVGCELAPFDDVGGGGEDFDAPADQGASLRESRLQE